MIECIYIQIPKQNADLMVLNCYFGISTSRKVIACLSMSSLSAQRELSQQELLQISKFRYSLSHYHKHTSISTSQINHFSVQVIAFSVIFTEVCAQKQWVEANWNSFQFDAYTYSIHDLIRVGDKFRRWIAFTVVNYICQLVLSSDKIFWDPELAGVFSNFRANKSLVFHRICWFR